MSTFEYDLTFSFAGQDRELVESIAKRLRAKYSIFYRYYQKRIDPRLIFLLNHPKKYLNKKMILLKKIGKKSYK